MTPTASTTRPEHSAAFAPRFDPAGFLCDPDDWTPALALALARESGIATLTERHWKVIDFVRERYFSIGALPVMRLVCRAVGQDPRNAHDLFSSCRSLWRIAGLPDPGEEARSYMN